MNILITELELILLSFIIIKKNIIVFFYINNIMFYFKKKNKKNVNEIRRELKKKFELKYIKELK